MYTYKAVCILWQAQFGATVTHVHITLLTYVHLYELYISISLKPSNSIIDLKSTSQNHRGLDLYRKQTDCEKFIFGEGITSLVKLEKSWLHLNIWCSEFLKRSHDGYDFICIYENKLEIK